MRKLFLPLALLLLTACGESKFYQSVDYLIFVDSIAAPQVVSSNQTLTVRFFGHVGPNNCFSFNGFETRKEANRLDVLVLGRYYSTGRCVGEDVFLQDQALQVSPPFVDPFLVRVFQPNGDTLTAAISVR